ncbi:MAG TPA: hypothetical protein VIK53_19485 [Verrucomicrobiae bacterium]
MKNKLFPQPIGKLSDLGSPRQWLQDALGIALAAALLISLLLI